MKGKISNCQEIRDKHDHQRTKIRESWIEGVFEDDQGKGSGKGIKKMGR